MHSNANGNPEKNAPIIISIEPGSCVTFESLYTYGIILLILILYYKKKSLDFLKCTKISSISHRFGYEMTRSLINYANWM